MPTVNNSLMYLHKANIHLEMHKDLVLFIKLHFVPRNKEDAASVGPVGLDKDFFLSNSCSIL